jgi:uncharacterized membrane protein YraQ (UPF0718 family)
MTELVLRRAGAAWQQIRAVDTVWLLVAVLPLAVWLLDPASAPDVLGIAAGAFAGTMPYMAAAIALIALLKATGAEGVVGAAFKGRESRMIVVAAMIGGLAPFCSCEVIPFIAALLAAGTPISAVMAFWLSSPLMDPPTFAITAGALGVEFAIGKTVAAVAIGLMGGFATRALVRGGFFADPLRPRESKGCCSGPNPFSGRPVWRFWEHAERRAVFGQTAAEQALFLGKWLAFAYLLEGLLVVHVPAEAIGALVGGDGILPVVTGALVGAPAYLNGYAAPALIAGLMEQGMGPGAAMSFMVAGAASCIPAMAAVFALVRRRVFLAYVGFGITGAIVAGLVFPLALSLV